MVPKRKLGTVNGSFVSKKMFMREKKSLFSPLSQIFEEKKEVFFFRIKQKNHKKVRRTSKRHFECSKAKMKANHSVICFFGQLD